MSPRFLVSLAFACGSAAGAADPSFPAPADAAPAALTAWADRIDAELRGDILPFWLQHARDPGSGRWTPELTSDLTLHPDRPRGALLAARILWTFSAAERARPDPAGLALARAAYADLETHFRDPKYGGYFWMIDANGRPRDDTKQLYGQAFVIYALAEFHRATGDPAARERAIELYRLVERHFRDRAHGGYHEGLTRDWQGAGNRRLNRLGEGFAKSQNTHLHAMEAFTNLLRIWPDDGLRQELRALVELMLAQVLGPDGRHLGLFFDPDWRLRSDTISFGHDIEFSWLLVETAEVLGDPALLARARAAAVTVARGTLAEGVDADGAVLNEAGPHGLTDTGKDWWPQAEAVVGFLNAYQISGDERFLAAARKTWAFIEQRLCDREHGEWYWGVTREGRVRRGTIKLGFWKCPYHNSRACLEAGARLRALAAVPVSPAP